MESTALKRAMVRLRRAREKGAMAFIECLGVSQEDTMKSLLSTETLGRSLGSHDAVELVSGSAMAMIAGKKIPVSTLYPPQKRDGDLSPTIECSTRHWLNPYARAKYIFVVEDT